MFETPFVPSERLEQSQFSAQSERRVLLVCPPFQELEVASFATARLATLLRREGLACEEAYLHFEMARLLGKQGYDKAVNAFLDAELLFAEGLHGTLSDEAEERLGELFFDGPTRRALLARYEAVCLERIARSAPALVGITTSNCQLMAALWLAKRIKEAFPETVVVLGGSACSEPMGTALIHAYPYVDWAVSGFGEQPLLALARGESPKERVLCAHERLPFEQLVLPDYSPFLREANEFDNPQQMRLTYEGSRGCWWGMKHQCTFCALNRLQPGYEEKPSALVVQELRNLWAKYTRSVLATDLILSPRHLDEALPALAELGDGPPLFYEVKANLTQAQVTALARANIRHIQPGIESLSTRHLRQMSKGTTMLQNVALLKWCKERHVHAYWSLLCRIPGEEESDYDEQIQLMKRIPHLIPPMGANLVHIDRYSPYFENFLEYGWEAIAPMALYPRIHPQLSVEELQNVAFHFEGVGGVNADRYYSRLKGAIAEWKRRHGQRDGLYQPRRSHLVSVVAGKREPLALDATTEHIIEMTHDIVGVQQLVEECSTTIAYLRELEARGILLIEGERAVNLALRPQALLAPC